jgi:hypothetical protein
MKICAVIPVGTFLYERLYKRSSLPGVDQVIDCATCIISNLEPPAQDVWSLVYFHFCAELSELATLGHASVTYPENLSIYLGYMVNGG